MNDYDALYKLVVASLVTKVGEKVTMEKLEEELAADHHLLQAVLEDLHQNQSVLGKKSNRYGPLEYVIAMVKPGVAKEHARLSSGSPSTLSVNVQIVNGSGNVSIQGGGNSADLTSQK